jgi:hypothetical protein
MVLGGVKTGFELVVDSIRVFWRYPRLVVPLLGTWVVVAGLTLWWQFFRPALAWRGMLALGFGVIFLQAFVLAVSCSLLLEMVEQVERGGSPSIVQALGDTLRENLLSMLPLILVWSVVWFLLSVVEAFFEDDSEATGEFSAENAARALGGGNTSLLGLGFDALRKGVRMLVFLVLPAIAWEDRGFVAASRRGYGVFRENIAAVATGFSLTYLIAGALFLPTVVVFEASDLGLITLSVTEWSLVIGYIGVAWSFSIYLEQMFVADLFLWHKEWEQAVEAARQDGRSEPSMRDVPRPTLLDDVASLEERKLPGGDSEPVQESDRTDSD